MEGQAFVPVEIHLHRQGRLCHQGFIKWVLMVIEVFEAGPVATNGYLIADGQGGAALVIDAPQGVAPLMVQRARRWNVPIGCLVNTHAHWDHYVNNAELLRLTGATFGIHRESAPL